MYKVELKRYGVWYVLDKKLEDISQPFFIKIRQHLLTIPMFPLNPISVSAVWIKFTIKKNISF